MLRRKEPERIQVWTGGSPSRSRRGYDKPEDKRNWTTMAELADLLGLHRDTVKRAVHAGRLPEAEFRSAHGWRLWSPEQVASIIRLRTRG